MNKKYRLLSWIAIAIAVAVFVLVNVFMSALTKKVNIKIDLTSNKKYELTEESYAYLKEYDKDTTIYILASVTEQDINARAILDRYAAANSHIKLENVDVSKNPTFGRDYVSEGKTLTENSVIVVSGEKSRVIENSEFYPTSNGNITGIDVESKITSALKYVSSDAQFKAYFTTGHNEADFKGAKEALEAENYVLGDVATLTEDIPQDADVVIVPRPLTDFTTGEIAKLDTYVRDGGALQLYVSGECPELTNINTWLSANGIGINEDVIVESKDNAVGSGGSYLFVMNYVKNDITENIIAKNKVSGYVPFAKSLKMTATSGAYTVESCLSSSDNSYTSADFDKPTRDTAVSTGAADIALMSTNADTNGKIYVSGTTMLLSYSVSDVNNIGFANFAYFTAVTNSMSGAGEAFVVPVKSVGANLLVMNSIQKAVMFIVVVILVPLLLLALGIAVFFRRRNM
ncbi:MAG: Gldg family protein [Candidatus Ornithomonoglobus sp.]